VTCSSAVQRIKGYELCLQIFRVIIRHLAVTLLSSMGLLAPLAAAMGMQCDMSCHVRHAGIFQLRAITAQ
jgi:hypothetical protein